jgi:hypothetical protein
MNPIVIVTLLTIAVVVFVLLFGRKRISEDASPAEEDIEAGPAPSPEGSQCPVCPACPVPKPCPACPVSKDPPPIRIILETPDGPLAHQNQTLVRESPYRPLYTPVDPTLFLKNPTVRVPA